MYTYIGTWEEEAVLLLLSKKASVAHARWPVTPFKLIICKQYASARQLSLYLYSRGSSRNEVFSRPWQWCRTPPRRFFFRTADANRASVNYRYVFSLSRSILFSAVVAEETGRYATGDNEPRPSNWSPRVEDARNSSVMQPQSSGKKRSRDRASIYSRFSRGNAA